MKKLSVSVSNDVWNRIYLLSSSTSISETVRTLLVMGLAHIERPKANVPKAEVKLAKKPNDLITFLFIAFSIYGLLTFAVDAFVFIYRGIVAIGSVL